MFCWSSYLFDSLNKTLTCENQSNSGILQQIVYKIKIKPIRTRLKPVLIPMGKLLQN